MKTVLKIFAIICALTLVVTCFAACGNKDVYGPSKGPQSSNKDNTESTDSSSNDTQGSDTTSNQSTTPSSNDSTVSSQESNVGTTNTENNSQPYPIVDASGETTIEGDHGPIIPF